MKLPLPQKFNFKRDTYHRLLTLKSGTYGDSCKEFKDTARCSLSVCPATHLYHSPQTRLQKFQSLCVFSLVLQITCLLNNIHAPLFRVHSGPRAQLNVPFVCSFCTPSPSPPNTLGKHVLLRIRALSVPALQIILNSKGFFFDLVERSINYALAPRSQRSASATDYTEWFAYVVSNLSWHSSAVKEPKNWRHFVSTSTMGGMLLTKMQKTDETETGRNKCTISERLKKFLTLLKYYYFLYLIRVFCCCKRTQICYKNLADSCMREQKLTFCPKQSVSCSNFN